MTSLLEGARELVTRGTDIGARLDGLEPADRGRPRSPRRRAGRRRPRDGRAGHRAGCGSPPSTPSSRSPAPPGRASPRRSTRSPASSSPRSAYAVRRPPGRPPACGGATAPTSCSSGSASPPGTRSPATPCSTPGAEDRALDGIVLLDLPDHDSTEVSHHLEVDRLVELADLLVWVLDPQKYADAAIHDRYLAPLASHQDVMLVVLNHIDTVPEARREAMVADVRRLLDAGRPARRPRARRSAPATGSASTSSRRDRRAGRRPRRPPATRLEADVAHGRRAARRGARLRPAPRAGRRARRRARRRVRRRGRRADRRRRGRALDAGCAPAARPAGRSRRGSPG